jgi:hypothetical protein
VVVRFKQIHPIYYLSTLPYQVILLPVESIIYSYRKKGWSIIDVLWGQPIKLIQVAFNSELRENQWNNLLFLEIVPSHCFGASEVQT